MDRLFGGGLPLGTLTIVQEDGVSSNHVALLQYFVGEGIACQQVRSHCVPRTWPTFKNAQSVLLSAPSCRTADQALDLVPLCSQASNRPPVCN